jgi:hypothetical protein
MRKVVFVAWVLLATLTLALDAVAVPPLPAGTAPATKPTTPPPAGSATIFVVGFTNQTVPAGALYKGGPVDVKLDLENRGGTTASVKVRLSHTSMTTLEQTVNVPPKATQALTSLVLTDTGGVDESCEPHVYGITLEGPGADTRPRRVNITPTCSWTPKLEDEWSAGIPEDVTKTMAYLSNVSVEGPILCASGPRFKMTVVNHTAKPAAYLSVYAGAGSPVKGQSQTPNFFVAPGGSTPVAFGGNGSGGGVPKSPQEITLFDPSGGLTKEIANRHIRVGFSRLCRLSTSGLYF